MVFSSLLFMFQFLPVILFVYYITPVKFRNAVLFFLSLVFYAWGEPIYIVLMLFSTVVDYFHGRITDMLLIKGKRQAAKLAVLSSVVINLSLLGFFKYYDFLAQSVNAAFHTNLPLLQVSLPIGISFYTFQTMSYTIDIYRREAKVQKNILSFGAYVAMFPQLIAGPIVQYKQIAKELESRKESIAFFAAGVRRFLFGLAKKVLLANQIGLVYDTVIKMGASEQSVLAAWLGIFAFSFQIYFDFSGYSDMAIGLGQIFGFRFPENFNYPYISKSVSEFWRRWHMTLGSWFREYVYIPLGGNRCGFIKQFRNLFVVWLLTGIWHGASWNFLFWGLYYGLLILLEKFVFGNWLKKLPSFVAHFYTISAVLFGWVLFAFDSLKDGMSYISMLFGGNGITVVNSDFIYILYNNAFLLLILLFACTPVPKLAYQTIGLKFQKGFIKTGIETVYFMVLLLLSIAYLVDATYNPFLYFRF